MAALTLGELRALTGLLETRLLALLHARVTCEEALALELAAQVRVGLHERPGDAVPQRDRLRRHASAVDLRDDVHARLVAGRLERLPRVPAERGTREVGVELLAVDGVGALPRLQDHAGHGALALAGGAVTSVGGQVERSAGSGGCPRRLLDGRGLLAFGD